jgi:hypothetical protein
LTGLWDKSGARGWLYDKGGAARGRLGPTLGSVMLASLLFSEVAAAMVGAEAIFFTTVVAAWLILSAVVGLKNVLDAGCFFMLISLGIVVVVGVASHGADSLPT